MIYLDNAATSWPKPPEVMKAMQKFMNDAGVNPGRSGHRLSVEAGRIVYNCREALGIFFNLRNPLNVLFGSNATEALNLAIFGLLNPGDHVITTSMEHNAVMRPLRYLESRGDIALSIIRISEGGDIDLAEIIASIRDNTRIIAVNHASNVTGCILPVQEIGKIAREYDLTLLVDAAQSGGAIPIDMEKDLIDLLAVTGHKSLLGPMGTGALLINSRVNVKEMKPLKRGGTGSRSELERQPAFLPDKFESGTLNAVGLAGLAAGIKWLQERGIDTIRESEKTNITSLIDGLKGIPGVTLYCADSIDNQTGTVSFAVENISPSEFGTALDEEFEIMSRVGLHCAPAAHKTIGTYPEGTIRFSIGYFNNPDEITSAIKAVSDIVLKTKR